MKERKPNTDPLDSFDGVGMSHDDDWEEEDLEAAPGQDSLAGFSIRSIWRGIRQTVQTDEATYGNNVIELEKARAKRRNAKTQPSDKIVDKTTPLIEAALAETSGIDQATLDRIWDGIQRRIAEEEQETT